MIFSVWIVSPPGYQHSQAFAEVALSLRDGLRELGHGAEIATNPPVGLGNVIILGAHLLHPEDITAFDKPVIWQLEQIPDSQEGWRTGSAVHAAYLETLRRAEIWDYSEKNIGLLSGLGIEAKLCRVGYMPALEELPAAYPDAIDVLVYGSVNPRRRYVVERLLQRTWRGVDGVELPVRVTSMFNCYGDVRNAMIRRAKVVLNVHYYESKVFEIVRCSLLFANKKCVVSETGSGVEDFAGGMYLAQYEDLASACVSALENSEKSEAIAERGYEIFSKMRQSNFLREVLK